jgi:hypothetical protein
MNSANIPPQQPRQRQQQRRGHKIGFTTARNMQQHEWRFAGASAGEEAVRVRRFCHRGMIIAEFAPHVRHRSPPAGVNELARLCRQ